MISHPPRRRPLRRRFSGARLALFGLLFLAATGAGLYAVYGLFAGHRLGFDRRLLAPPLLAATAVLLLLYFVTDGLRLHYTLRALGYRLPFAALFRLVFINLFFSNVTPLATGGGFAQIWYLQRHGVPLGRATAATTIRTLLAVIVIFTLTPLSLWWFEEAAAGEPALTGRIAPLLSLLVLLYLGFFALLLLRPRWLLAPLTALLDGLARAGLLAAARRCRWQATLAREIGHFTASFGDYLCGRRRFVLLSWLFTLLFLLCLFSFPALLIAGLGYRVDYLESLGLLVVTTFIMYFAPTPGASGISEGVFGSLIQSQLSPEHLVLVVLGWRLLTIYLGMAIGLGVWLRELLRRPGVPR